MFTPSYMAIFVRASTIFYTEHFSKKNALSERSLRAFFCMLMLFFGCCWRWGYSWRATGGRGAEGNRGIIKALKLRDSTSSIEIGTCDGISGLNQRQFWREREVNFEDDWLASNLQVVDGIGALSY